MKHAGHRLQQGLTVIELLTVLAIVAILAKLAAPAFGNYLGTQRLKGAANEMVSDLQYARSESVQRNSNVTVTLSYSSGTTLNGYSIAQSSTSLKSVSWDNGTTGSAAASSVVLTYEPVRGTASSSAGGTSTSFTLSNSFASGKSLKVTVNSLGRVELCSPSGTVQGATSC